MTENLIEGLLEEIERNKELLEAYRSIPLGEFGAMMIEKDIKDAEEGIQNNDITRMLRTYKTLKSNQ